METEKEPEYVEVITNNGCYKSLESIRESIPFLPEHVYLILYLRYNEGLLSDTEKERVESELARHRENLNKETEYYNDFFKDYLSNNNVNGQLDSSAGLQTDNN